jgi:DNA invertase Pin-like site-specific DNA recombinase
MTVIGYARVSTDGQTLDSQQSALQAAGAEKVFAEKISGAVTDRRHLARSTRDLLNVLASISEKGAGFRSIADPMIDTTKAVPAEFESGDSNGFRDERVFGH